MGPLPGALRTWRPMLTTDLARIGPPAVATAAAECGWAPRSSCRSTSTATGWACCRCWGRCSGPSRPRTPRCCARCSTSSAPGSPTCARSGGRLHRRSQRARPTRPARARAGRPPARAAAEPDSASGDRPDRPAGARRVGGDPRRLDKPARMRAAARPGPARPRSACGASTRRRTSRPAAQSSGRGAHAAPEDANPSESTTRALPTVPRAAGTRRRRGRRVAAPPGLRPAGRARCSRASARRRSAGATGRVTGAALGGMAGRRRPSALGTCTARRCCALIHTRVSIGARAE